MYEHIKAYRAQKGGWDELREQRVFKAIVEQRAARSGKRKRYGIIGKGVIAAAALTGVLIGILYYEASPEEAARQNRRIAASTQRDLETVRPDTPENASVLTLASAGQVTLFDGADVSIIEQQTDTVRLEQEEGRALYDIVHRDGRLVQVRAAGIAITVVGTSFLVSIDDPVVRVEVKRGVVRLEDGKQTVVLEAPETISVTIPTNAPHWRRHPRKTRANRKIIREVVKEDDAVVKNDDLFSEVDQARQQGDLTKATQLLHQIIAQKKSSFSVASAEFTLGKVERARGRHAAAARAFYRCAKHAPNHSLGEDALAEAAFSWQTAGKTEKAKNIARTYLENYPRGMYLAKIKRLVD